MLLNNFFFIETVDVSSNEIKTLLRIERLHPIFNGHFPGKPVVPGVCMVQMIKEIIEKYDGKNYILHESSNLKFLAVLDPDESNEVEATITIEERNGTSIRINATIFAGSLTFFKMKASLKFT